MNIPEEQIETILQRAPQLSAPAGLKERLIANVRVEAPENSARLGVRNAQVRLSPRSWLRQWWPALGSALLLVGCGVMLAVQHAEIQDLKKALRELSEPRRASAPAAPIVAESATPALASTTASLEQEEIARLQQQAAALGAEVDRLEHLRAENDKLRGQLAAPAAVAFTPEEQEALAKAREKALTIQCVNNLKQLGLAARIWALDNSDHNPQNVLQMTNEMSTPKILVCPADSSHSVAADWASFTAANCSYEYLAAGGSDTDPMRVLFRCPVHGNIGLCDGSVHMAVARNNPERLVQRDGKLYLEPPKPTSEGQEP